MHKTIEIDHLSRIEKLMVMEAIWEDLSNEDEQIKSPDWHKKVLQRTEQRLNSGQEKIMDWSEAKKELRSQFE